MCDELGDDEYMQAYVEEMGSTSLCSIHEVGDGCSQRQKDFITKMKSKSQEEIIAQHARLSTMKTTKLTTANKQWIVQRLGILSQFMPSEKVSSGEL